MRGLYKLRNNNEPRGFNFGKHESDAQNEFHRYAGAKSEDFRDSSGPRVVAQNPAALSLHQVSRART
jgi:hypothetical protein